MQSVQADVSALNADIPEPDWDEFRGSVRSALLSRSVQRASAVRRWTGWPIRPAMAWGLSLLLAVGITTASFIWHIQSTEVPGTIPKTPSVVETSLEFNPIDAEIAVWSQTGVFEELVQLDGDEEEALRRMLAAAQEGSAKQ